MSKNIHIKSVVPAGHRGCFSLPELGAELCLNPAEIYAHESRSDDPELRENVLVSLCSESKRVFYSNISRIKKKLIDAVGARKAAGYYIKRNKAGVYRTNAILTPR